MFGGKRSKRRRTRTERHIGFRDNDHPVLRGSNQGDWTIHMCTSSAKTAKEAVLGSSSLIGFTLSFPLHDTVPHFPGMGLGDFS